MSKLGRTWETWHCGCTEWDNACIYAWRLTMSNIGKSFYSYSTCINCTGNGNNVSGSSHKRRPGICLPTACTCQPYAEGTTRHRKFLGRRTFWPLKLVVLSSSLDLWRACAMAQCQRDANGEQNPCITGRTVVRGARLRAICKKCCQGASSKVHSSHNMGGFRNTFYHLVLVSVAPPKHHLPPKLYRDQCNHGSLSFPTQRGYLYTPNCLYN
jgi:hypothetical protein